MAMMEVKERNVCMEKMLLPMLEHMHKIEERGEKRMRRSSICAKERDDKEEEDEEECLIGWWNGNFGLSIVIGGFNR